VRAADGDSVDASMPAQLAGYIGAGERKRVPLGASCSVEGASERTRGLYQFGKVKEIGRSVAVATRDLAAV